MKTHVANQLVLEGDAKSSGGQHIAMDRALVANLRQEFNRLARNGVVGDPSGQPAYGYLRVSSRGQAEEGRSGLPRQLEHIAEKAAQEGLAIPWEMVFCDDHTGFRFEDRPALNRLLDEAKAGARAHVLVMEQPDRMSRDHAWRYGYLREQFQVRGVEFVYWKGYHSEIERSVIGSISEEGMRNELQRMHEGTLRKARSGRVTAKTPAYGYKFVDSHGRDRTHPESDWRRDKHYAVLDEEAQTMRLIFHRLAYEGATLMALANHLNDTGVPPPKNSAHWEQTLLSKMVKNPVYKGEFVAHKWYYKKVWSDRAQRMTTRKFQRPEDEWIIVPVPEIVSEATWSLAQEALERNRTKSTRNTHYDFLLGNLLTCAGCGCSFSANTKLHRKKNKTYLAPCYRCTTVQRPRAVREKIGCTQSQISAKTLDPLVWQALMDLLTSPETLSEAMDDYYMDSGMQQLHSQMELVDQRVRDRHTEDEKLYRAYMKDVFDEQEYADRRRELQVAVQALKEEKQSLSAQIIGQEEFRKRRRAVSDWVEEMRAQLLTLDVPYDIKRRIVRMVVDEVVLNVNEGWFQIKGILRGRFSIRDGQIVTIPAGKGSLRQSG